MHLKRKTVFQSNSNVHRKAEGQEKAAHKYQSHPFRSRVEKAVDLREE